MIPATSAISVLNEIATMADQPKGEFKKPGMAIRSQEMILTTLAQPASFAILFTWTGVTCLLSVKGLKTRFHSSNTNPVRSIRVPSNAPPNGERYPLVGGTRQHRFDGTSFKPRKHLENAQTPTTLVPAYFAGDRVHAVLGGITFGFTT